MSQEADRNRFRVGGKHHRNMLKDSADKVRKWCAGCGKPKKVFSGNDRCPDCGGTL